MDIWLRAWLHLHHRAGWAKAPTNHPWRQHNFTRKSSGWNYEDPRSGKRDVLVEIKKSTTVLLKETEYRCGTWAPSAELSGAVAQCQETVRAATEELATCFRVTDARGNPTGEELMSVEPRSFLVIGSLEQFQSGQGVNASRYKAFEGFRRNLRQPEILTFDELYERARFIVDHTANSDDLAQHEDEREIPF